MENLRELWNKTCLNAGIPAISTDTAARIRNKLKLTNHFRDLTKMIFKHKSVKANFITASKAQELDFNGKNFVKIK